jgi:hypothetical protein
MNALDDVAAASTILQAGQNVELHDSSSRSKFRKVAKLLHKLRVKRKKDVSSYLPIVSSHLFSEVEVPISHRFKFRFRRQGFPPELHPFLTEIHVPLSVVQVHRIWLAAARDHLLRLLPWFHIRDRTAKHLASRLAMCLALLLAHRYSNVARYLISIISACRDRSETNSTFRLSENPGSCFWAVERDDGRGELDGPYTRF